MSKNFWVLGVYFSRIEGYFEEYDNDKERLKSNVKFRIACIKELLKDIFPSSAMEGRLGEIIDEMYALADNPNFSDKFYDYHDEIIRIYFGLNEIYKKEYESIIKNYNGPCKKRLKEIVTMLLFNKLSCDWYEDEVNNLKNEMKKILSGETKDIDKTETEVVIINIEKFIRFDILYLLDYLIYSYNIIHETNRYVASRDTRIARYRAGGYINIGRELGFISRKENDILETMDKLVTKYDGPYKARLKELKKEIKSAIHSSSDVFYALVDEIELIMCGSVDIYQKQYDLIIKGYKGPHQDRLKKIVRTIAINKNMCRRNSYDYMCKLLDEMERILAAESRFIEIQSKINRLKALRAECKKINFIKKYSLDKIIESLEVKSRKL